MAKPLNPGIASLSAFALLAALLASLAGRAAAAEGPAATCAAASAYSSNREGVSVLILKAGKVVCEAYANGGGRDQGHEIWSGTKSFNGIMAAAAVQDGLLDLDEPVAKTLTEWRADPVKATMTIRQLLSLVGGQAGPPGRAPSYASAITVPLSARPGEKFQYGPTSFQVFGAVMQRKLAAAGKRPDVLAYITERILAPAGVTPTNWRRTPEGDLILPQGCILTAREWADFGEFVRNGGVVQGKPLVDPRAFRELFRGSRANPAYGISWWLPRATPAPDVVTASVDIVRHADELPMDMVVAAGAGNQRLYVIPSLGMTVVRQARFDPAAALGEGASRSADTDRAWSDTEFLRIVLQRQGAK